MGADGSFAAATEGIMDVGVLESLGGVTGSLSMMECTLNLACGSSSTGVGCDGEGRLGGVDILVGVLSSTALLSSGKFSMDGVFFRSAAHGSGGMDWVFSVGFSSCRVSRECVVSSFAAGLRL